MRGRRGMRRALCTAGIVMGMLTSVATVSAAPAAGGWTAVAANGAGVHFVGYGATASFTASRALFHCRQASRFPATCHIISDRHN